MRSVRLYLAIVAVLSLSTSARADGTYTNWLDSASAHGRYQTVRVRATYMLHADDQVQEAFVVAALSVRPQTLDGVEAVRCIDASGSYTFQGTFTIQGGQSAILATAPTSTYQTFPRYCMAYVELTSRKRGTVQVDLGIWAEMAP